MAVRLNPYIAFKDNTREAMEFYRGIFGGTLEMDTFAEFQMTQDEAESNKIMHAQLNGDNGLVFMASDTPDGVEYKPGANISMSLSGDDDALLSGYYDKLAEGGAKTMPLEKAPWGDKFGMVTDKFGISWMVNIAQPQA